jgi:hypothetical protein
VPAKAADRRKTFATTLHRIGHLAAVNSLRGNAGIYTPHGLFVGPKAKKKVAAF